MFRHRPCEVNLGLVSFPANRAGDISNVEPLTKRFNGEVYLWNCRY